MAPPPVKFHFSISSDDGERYGKTSDEAVIFYGVRRLGGGRLLADAQMKAGGLVTLRCFSTVNRTWAGLGGWLLIKRASS